LIKNAIFGQEILLTLDLPRSYQRERLLGNTRKVSSIYQIHNQNIDLESNLEFESIDLEESKIYNLGSEIERGNHEVEYLPFTEV